MGKSIMSVHNKLEKEKERRFKEDMVKEIVASKMLSEISRGVKGNFLLALKKEGFGKTRALRVLKEVESIEDNIIDSTITWEDVFGQIKVEYGDKVYEEMMKEC